MGGLTLVTYLGDNTTDAAVAIADALTTLGVPVVAYRGDSPTAIEEEVRGTTAQLVWMCGFATVQAIDAGRLAADIVAAPVFPGEEDATYRSVVVVRRDSGATSLDDLVGARLAVNERDSWSGYHAIRVHVAATGRRGPYFGSIAETGSHAASLEAVIDGAADTAAVDDTIWTDLAARDRRLDALAVVDRTRPWPAPPFSVSRALSPVIREALTAVLPTLHPQGLDGIRPATGADYDPIRRAAAEAAQIDLAAEVPW